MRLIYSGEIKKQAKTALLEHQTDYRKLVLQHAGVSSALMLILSLVGLWINRSIADTQGLDGVGTAAALQSMYTVILLAANVLLPFWQAGILYTSIRVVRRQNTEFSMLTQGFRRAMPLTGFYAMLLLIFFGIAMACLNLLIVPFMCVPVPEELQSAMEMLDYTDIAQMEAFYAEYYGEMKRYSMPLVIVFACVYGLIAAPLLYRFRMCNYLLMEDERAGVMASFGISSRMTRGERKNLFLLDLSFWWYHLLTVLISLIIYVPDLLNAAGINLPVSYETANLLAYIVYIICYLVFIGLAGAHYQVSMTCAYEKLRVSQENETVNVSEKS